jgi:hypothetical protein
LVPYEFGVATAITAASIGAILVTYVSVLKKNGWIGNATINQIKIVPPKKENPSPQPKENASPLNLESLEPEEFKETSEAVPQETIIDSATQDKKIVLKQKLAEKLIEAQKSSAEQNVSPHCTHYFGYMYSFQKNSQIPDECYSCPELIQCFKEPKN